MDTGRMTEPELEVEHDPARQEQQRQQQQAPQTETASTGDGDGGAQGARFRRARVMPWVATFAVAGAFFALCLAQSLDQPWNADTASMSLQGWDLVHGHLLLHGWWSSDVNFYTLDTPLYGLCLLVIGFGSTALHVAGALLYTFVFLAAAWLAKGREHGARAWLRVALTALLLTAPLFHGTLAGTLILVPDHCGTVIFALVSFTLVSRYTERRWTPWVLLAVLTLGQLGDATVRYVTVPALLIVWFLDTLLERRLRSPRHWLALATLASVAISLGLRAVMKHFGAYYLNKPHTQIAPSADWGWHLKGTWLSLLALFGVSSHFPGDSAGMVALTVIGGLVLLCGAASILYTVVHWTKVDVADRLLVVAIVVYLGAYAFSTVALRGGSGLYEIVGVLVLSGALGARTIPRLRVPGRQLSDRGRARAMLAGTVVAAVAATACMVSGSGLFRAPRTSPSQPLAAWLADHHLTYGIAGYWNAEPVTIYSGGSVQVRQVILVPGGFVPYAWNAPRRWFDAKQQDANFVIAQDYSQQPQSPLTPAAAESCFGQPSAIYRVDNFTVMVYPYNLLTRGRTPVLSPGA
jgi:hypothetical protein